MFLLLTLSACSILDNSKKNGKSLPLPLRQPPIPLRNSDITRRQLAALEDDASDLIQIALEKQKESAYLVKYHAKFSQ